MDSYHITAATPPLAEKTVQGARRRFFRVLPSEVSALPMVPGIPGPYRFFFYSFDCNEPMHVHVRRDRAVCKYWLEPVVLANNNGFSAKELNRIRKLILDNLDRIQEAWNEHCGEQ